MQAGLFVTKPALHGNPCENQDQPSPISVLEPPFEEEDSATSESCDMKPDDHGKFSQSHPQNFSHFHCHA